MLDLVRCSFSELSIQRMAIAGTYRQRIAGSYYTIPTTATRVRENQGASSKIGIKSRFNNTPRVRFDSHTRSGSDIRILRVEKHARISLVELMTCRGITREY